LNKKDFTIRYVGLKDGVHNSTFKINNKFFDLFEYSEIQKGNLDANIEIIKTSTMLTFNIEIIGTVELICDLCLDEFNHNLSFKESIFVKFGEEYEELDSNVIVINRNDNEFNISNLLYELIIVNLPIKKVHPLDNNGNKTCNPEMLKKINELLVYNNNSEQENISETDIT
jgi:uncharacterized metal-binding protein YceD (DUF177 family)